MKWSILPLSLSLLGQAVNALTPAEWRSQSIYFLLTDRFGRDDSSTSAPCDVNQRIYCGGTWQGIINQLDYIQGMGFTAIWITPVTEQFYESTGDGSSYHGYWQQNIYEVNRKHGTKQNLKSLADALHARGMYLMVDVVANHMGYRGPGNSVDYSVMNPFNKAEYYNNYCTITDYNNQNSVEKCWLGSNTVSLPDLATTHPWVRSTWNDWVRNLVNDYSIDGLRIDTVKHVEKDFWRPYNDAAGVYCVGEIFSGDPGYTCDYQNYMDGVLNYPIYYPLLNAFKSTSGSMSELRNMIGTVSNKCRDPTLLGNFIENHDNPRFAHYTNDISQAKNVLTFMFLTDGIPIVYAGQEQHYGGGEDPANREATWLSGYSRNSELYTWIAKTNKIRSLAIAKDSGFVTARNNPFYHDTTTLAMRKGSSDGQQLITIVSNKGAYGDGYTMQLTGHGYGSGATVMELYTCTSFTVNNGVIPVPMVSGQPRALVPSSWVAGSGLCGSTGPTTTTTATGGTNPTCVAATSLAIQFQHLVTTNYGDNVFIVGSISQLGSWNVANAIPLTAEQYTASNPEWRTTITLPVGTSFEYKFIKKLSSGTVVWESDPNRTYNVPSGCTGTVVTASASWR